MGLDAGLCCVHGRDGGRVRIRLAHTLLFLLILLRLRMIVQTIMLLLSDLQTMTAQVDSYVFLQLLLSTILAAPFLQSRPAMMLLVGIGATVVWVQRRRLMAELTGLLLASPRLLGLLHLSHFNLINFLLK